MTTHSNKQEQSGLQSWQSKVNHFTALPLGPLIALINLKSCSIQHILPLCHSSDVTHMSHKGSQNLWRRAGIFQRVLPKDECVYETVMTGTSWNACDLKIRNSNLKSSLNNAVTLTWVSDCTRFLLNSWGGSFSDQSVCYHTFHDKEYSHCWPDKSLRDMS